MASIRERSGRFSAEIRNAMYPPRQRTFATREEAIKWATSVEDAMRAGRYKIPTGFDWAAVKLPQYEGLSKGNGMLLIRLQLHSKQQVREFIRQLPSKIAVLRVFKRELREWAGITSADYPEARDVLPRDVQWCIEEVQSLGWTLTAKRIRLERVDAPEENARVKASNEYDVQSPIVAKPGATWTYRIGALVARYQLLRDRDIAWALDVSKQRLFQFKSNEYLAMPIEVQLQVIHLEDSLKMTSEMWDLLPPAKAARYKVIRAELLAWRSGNG